MGSLVVKIFDFPPKDIRKLEMKDIDEIQFYKLIGLTQDEIIIFDKNNIKMDEANNSDKTTIDTQTNVSKKKTLKLKTNVTNEDIKIIHNEIDNLNVSKKKTLKLKTNVTNEDIKIIHNEIDNLNVSKKKTPKLNIM